MVAPAVSIRRHAALEDFSLLCAPQEVGGKLHPALLVVRQRRHGHAQDPRRIHVNERRQDVALGVSRGLSSALPFMKILWGIRKQ
jgi:hypothetical protein